MRLLTAHKAAHKSVYSSQSAAGKITQQPYIRFLQSWILLALLFTFLFSVSNVVVHWITPYLPQATPNEQNAQINRTHVSVDPVLIPHHAACIPLNVEYSQQLDKVLPLLQMYINTQQNSKQMSPLCIIPNKTQTAI
ncbi:MAG: hypothetical protein PHP00_11430 [Thiotrichaceae bacterium]|nr:hypothetical protein [Thiotrichaceae bacterium]